MLFSEDIFEYGSLIFVYQPVITFRNFSCSFGVEEFSEYFCHERHYNICHQKYKDRNIEHILKKIWQVPENYGFNRPQYLYDRPDCKPGYEILPLFSRWFHNYVSRECKPCFRIVYFIGSGRSHSHFLAQ